VEVFRNDPEIFVNVIWGGEIKLWQKQIEILESLVKNQRTIVPAGFDVGKTFTLALAALFFLYTRPSIVLSTAPTWRQVESILWTEINELWHRAKIKLPGELLKTRLNVKEDRRWFAMGLSTDKPEKFQGYHEENILVEIDEGPGVPKVIWEAIEGIMGSRGARILSAGNPASIYDSFGQASLSTFWNCIPISCYDHPNVIQDKIIYPKMVTKQWCEDMKQVWGENSAYYVSRVLGQFPTSDIDTVLPLLWIEKAMDRKPEDVGDIEIGLDVAAGGVDRTVFAIRKGNSIVEIKIYRGLDNQDTMKTVGRAEFLLRQYDSKRIKVDQTGVGKGVADRLKEVGYSVLGVDFGSRASDPAQFSNVAAEMWWGMRELMRQDLISLPKDLELKKDLASRKYIPVSYKQFQLEKKEDMKRRGLESCDIGDAIALAFYSPPERKVLLGWGL
jgi:hypothetical protein